MVIAVSVDISDQVRADLVLARRCNFAFNQVNQNGREEEALLSHCRHRETH